MQKSLIVKDPQILGGKPIVAGTRISVEVILEFLAGGMEIKEILKEYPFLTQKQVKAAIEYAAKKVSSKKSSSQQDIKDFKNPVTLHEISRRR